jgi:hypothetical protein
MMACPVIYPTLIRRAGIWSDLNPQVHKYETEVKHKPIMVFVGNSLNKLGLK